MGGLYKGGHFPYIFSCSVRVEETRRVFLRFLNFEVEKSHSNSFVSNFQRRKMVNYRYPIVDGELYWRQNKFLKLKKQIIMVEIILEEMDMGSIEEESEFEMIELEIMEEQERKYREELEELVPDEISGGKGRDLGRGDISEIDKELVPDEIISGGLAEDLGGGDILEIEEELVPDEIISGGLDRDLDYKFSLGSDIWSEVVVSLVGNLGGFFFRELLVWLD